MEIGAEIIVEEYFGLTLDQILDPVRQYDVGEYVFIEHPVHRNTPVQVTEKKDCVYLDDRRVRHIIMK